MSRTGAAMPGLHGTPGRSRMKKRSSQKGSDGGHNGLKDIDATLGNNNYARLRFGIGSEFSKGRQIDYVLGKWTADEIKSLDEKIKLACEAVNSFMFEGIERAMTKYNKQ